MTKAVFVWIVEIPAMERNDGCHHVGIGPRWSRCHLCLVCKKKFLVASPATFDWDACVRYGDYVHRFVSLLNFGLHGSGWSSRHDCQQFRAFRVYFRETVTTSVVAYMYRRGLSRAICVSSVCRIPFWSARDSMYNVCGMLSVALEFSGPVVMSANVSRRSVHMLDVRR